MRFARKKIVAGGMAAAAAFATITGGWIWGEHEVAAKVKELAAARGYDAEIDHASLHLSGIVLHDLEIRGEQITAHFDEVGVQGALWSLVQDGREAVEFVQVRGGEVNVTPRADSEVDASSSANDADSERTSDTENIQEDVRPERNGADLFGFEVEALNVAAVLRDGHGVVASANMHVRASGNDVTLQLSNTAVGANPGHTFAAEHLEVVATKDAAGWQLKEVRSAAPVLTLGDDDSATRDRLMAFAPPVSHPDEQPLEEPEHEAGSGLESWLERLADDGVLVVDGGTVVRQSGPDREVLLGAISGRLTRAGSSLSLVGNGEGDGGSRVACDLMIDPSTPSAQGSLEVEQVALDILTPFLPELPWWEPENGRISGTAQLDASSEGILTLDGTLEVSGVGLEHERLAPHPVTDIGFVASGHAVWDVAARRVELTDGEIRVGDAQLGLEASASQSADQWTLGLDMTMPPTSCNDVVGAIPEGLLGQTAGFSWRGRMRGTLHLAIDSTDFSETELDIRVNNQCRFVDIPVMADIQRVQGPFTHQVYSPDGDLYDMRAGPGTRNWVPMAAMSPFLVQAVIGHEDAGFLRHRGFAVHAIRDALARNLREGRYVVGASTISMQLTKNLFLHRDKTAARKIQEVLLTWWIESSLTKEQILELYLNIIEYGPNVYGIVQASEHYFGRRPVELTAAEAVFLVTILPNPKAYHDQYERGSLSRSMRGRIRRFLNHLRSRGRIDSVALADGLAQLESGFSFARGDAMGPIHEAAGGIGALPFSLSTVGGLFGDDDLFDPAADPYEAATY